MPLDVHIGSGRTTKGHSRSFGPGVGRGGVEVGKESSRSRSGNVVGEPSVLCGAELQGRMAGCVRAEYTASLGHAGGFAEDVCTKESRLHVVPLLSLEKRRYRAGIGAYPGIGRCGSVARI